MKILIMVLSCMKPPFDKLYNTQKETWDSIKIEGVETVYYFGDHFNYMHIPFKECIEENWNSDWDYIYRTNSSSYVNKNLLVEFLKDLPRTNLWIGDESGYNSGASFIVSRDLAKILMEELPSNQHPYEDKLCMEILTSKGYKCLPGQRCYYNHNEGSWFDCYHIRCKPEGVHSGVDGTSDDRERDIQAMKNIFNNIKK